MTQLQLTKDNFNQLLKAYSNDDLERLLVKYPYFQQAHILLAKKYQQENNPKFDEQLQLAVLYSQDREFLFSVFRQSEDAGSLSNTEVPELKTEPLANLQVEEQIETLSTWLEEKPVDNKEEPQEIQTVEDLVRPVAAEVTVEINKEIVIEENVAQFEPVEELTKEFIITEPHTFEEWLDAFSQSAVPKIEPADIQTNAGEDITPAVVEMQDEELDVLMRSHLPVHELVEEETHYSRGLEKFIEEQKQKHRLQEVRMPAYENELAPELITETIAKVYEMQKKYSKAIRAYEILALKYPEKSDFFAARINYLKNNI